MHKSAWLLIVLVLVILILALPGCSGGGRAGGGTVDTAAKGVKPPPPPPPPPVPAAPGRITFDKVVGRARQVFWMKPDSTSVTQITTQGTNYGAAWSPNGAYLCLSSNRGGTGYALWRVNNNGTNPVQLTFPTSVNDVHEWADWSPDGQWIAFTNKVGTAAARRLFVLNVSSLAVTQLTSDAYGRMEDYAPCFSPDSTKIMFASAPYVDDGTNGLFVIPVTGGTPQRVTADGVTASHPEWSSAVAGGLSTLVYTNLTDLVTDRVNANGELQGPSATVPTANTGSEQRPSLSIDGAWVVCVRSGYVIRLKLGATAEEYNLGSGSNPEWSPVDLGS